jgi:uncharacterized repeat protein (TIGR01451 family)
VISGNGSLTLNAPTHGVVSASPTVITGTVPINLRTTSGVTESVRIGAATFTVNQDAGSCQDSTVSPQSITIPSRGDPQPLDLVIPYGTQGNRCIWQVVAAPWIYASGLSSYGPGTIGVGAGPNDFSQRSTILTVAGHSVTVTQTGSTCTGTASISTANTSAQGGDGIVAITPSSSICRWSAFSLTPWISFYGNGAANPAGQGAGFAPFIFASNPTGTSRTGQILIADVTLSFTQDAGPAGSMSNFCYYSVSSPPQVPATGGSIPISVTTTAGCRWSALALPAWLSPVNGNTRVGSDTLIFTAGPNSGPARTATIGIAGSSVSVMQAGAPSLSIVKAHSGNFAPGQMNATYTVTVSNAAGSAPTSGTVTVTEVLPSGLTLVSMSGSGWTCQTTTCTRAEVLTGGAAYAPITVTVNVAANATSPQINQVNVSGGGSASASASNSTTIATPTFSVSHTSLSFSSSNGIATSPQTVRVNFAASGGVPWTATSNQPNIVVLQGSGSGNGSFQVSASNGPSGIVTVTATGATGSPRQIQVNITNGPLGNPFGSFDTPADNTAGVAGAIPVTGWALDALEVVKVDIWREPVGNEPVGALIFIGDAVFVEGARPDVEVLNTNVPFNYRAGWGYQMLTNFLPNGNGPFKLHAIAHNKGGNSTDLGTKTIIVDNVHASKPFGTIDTPGQGGAASGNAFVNFGWALTQNPYGIPTNGSTISVVIDGQNVGHPTYNQFRSDIANLFPGLVNSNGAVGFFYIDTTALNPGVHTISWNVFDNAGHGDGIGSRYFSVFNSGNGSIAEPEAPMEPAKSHPHAIEIEEVGQVELPLGAMSGYQLVNGEHRPLPIGSSLKRGVFYWQPGPGFLGEYHLVFAHQDGTQSHVRVKIQPKTYPR